MVEAMTARRNWASCSAWVSGLVTAVADMGASSVGRRRLFVALRPAPETGEPMSEFPRAARAAALLHVLDFGRAAAEGLLRQRRLHEFVEIAVEHRAGIGSRDAGAQVLDHLVGLQHVGADLVAPAD